MTHSIKCLPPKRLTWCAVTRTRENTSATSRCSSRGACSIKTRYSSRQQVVLWISVRLSESYFLEETEPKTRSNTKKDRDQSTRCHSFLFQPDRPQIQSTSPSKRRIRSVQQSHEHFVGIEYNTEENDDVLERTT